MNYSLNHIKRAFEIARLPEWFSDQVVSYLPEAVKELDIIHAETLNDFFGAFCIKNNITEDALKSRNRDTKLIVLRKKFAILAKRNFPNHSLNEIGAEICRDHSTIIHYFKREKTRKEKRDNLERMKNEFKPMTK